MSLPNLLEGCLDLSNCITLEILNFLEGSSYDTKCLWIDPGSSKQLVDLGILSFQRFLDSLVLLLQDEVPDSSLLMDLIHEAVELIKQLLLFPLKVLELLKSHLILPLDLLGGALKLGNALLGFSELLHDNVVFLLGFQKLANLLIGLSQRLNHFVVSLLLVHLFLLGVRVLFSSITKLILQLFDNIEISVSNLIVIVLDLSILLSMLSSKLSNGSILLLLNHSNLTLSLVLHLGSKIISLGLELEMDLVADSLKLLSLFGLDLVLLLGQGIQVLLVALLLLLDRHFDGTEILLQLPLVDTVLILHVLQGDLSLFL